MRSSIVCDIRHIVQFVVIYQYVVAQYLAASRYLVCGDRSLLLLAAGAPILIENVRGQFCDCQLVICPNA
jgi:hypothetical protein